MPTTIDSAGITFNDATSLTSAVLAANSVGATQIANGSVTAAKLGTNEQKQICKAWVNFNGTTSPGTIRSSYNVSSVTKNGTGDYTVNFATAMADANYAISGFASNQDNNTTEAWIVSRQLNSVYTVNAVQITVTEIPLNRSDCPVVCVQIFGN